MKLRNFLWVLLLPVSFTGLNVQDVQMEVIKETIPTYGVGAPEIDQIFFTGRVYQGAEGYIYPYALYDVLTDEKADKEYEIIDLRNQYVQIGVLPEIGGRIFQATDLKDDYHFIYTQTGIKPALIGMLEAWLSGGVEWNIPDHHRASTYMLVDWTMEENSDGSKTVWVGETGLRHRLKWSVGVTVFPNSSSDETTIRSSIRFLRSSQCSIGQTFRHTAMRTIRSSSSLMSSSGQTTTRSISPAGHTGL